MERRGDLFPAVQHVGAEQILEAACHPLAVVQDGRTAGDVSQRDAGEMSGVMNSLGEGLNILVAKGTAFAVGYFASMAGGVDPVWNTICGLLG